ncbi:MAG: DUF2125 domain-containing protein [Alphaproteobacteria bacterium]|nr:MAG: DUF2125 domain-containing protein [Alphaproteobacteria bacterium]
MSSPRRRPMRRKKIFAERSRTAPATIFWTLAAVSVLGIIAYGILWHLMSNAMRSRIEETIAEARSQGFALRAPRIDESGFPSRVAITISGLSARFAGDGARLSLSLGGARLETLPWHPDRLALEGRGLRFSLGAFDLDAERLEGTVRDTREGTAFAVALEHAAIFLPALEKAPLRPLRLKIAGLSNSAAPAMESTDEETIEEPLAWRVGILAEDVAIGERRPKTEPGTARGIAVIEMQLAWHGNAVWPPTRTRLARWRNAGGTLDVERFALHIGASVLEAEGTVSLDERMRPLGAFTLHVADPRPLLDTLVLHGLVSLPMARAISRRIGVRERETGKRDKVDLPMMIADGQVTIDGVPMGRIAPLD